MKKLVLVIFGVGAVAFGVAKFLLRSPQVKPQQIAETSVGTSYWTCPMHPQVHVDKPGECPICHMKLVQVKDHGADHGHESERENRAMVEVAPQGEKLAGIQKVTVEKMDLTVRIPVAGRLMAATSVAFQVYESDLRDVKPGLMFTGVSSFAPDAEISGVITSVDAIVDPTSRTVRVEGRINKAPRGLIAETTFGGAIEVALKNVTAVPESAVLHTGGGDLVYLIHDDGRLMAVPVRLGQKAESYYQVLEGLEPGAVISAGPNFLIDSEAKIRGVNGGQSGHSHH